MTDHRKHKGVTYDKKAKRYRAYIFVDKKRQYIGYFEKFEDAVNARKAAEEEHGTHRTTSKMIDLTDQKFGELYVIGLSHQRGTNGTRLWECRCSCTNVVYLLGASLRAGYYKSCGCLRDDKRDDGVKKHITADQIAGTRKTALKAKLHKDNKSGHKGVRFNEDRQKWTAHIGFKGKQINLGYFIKKEDAIAARQAAEEKYHKPILEENDNE